MIVSARDPAIDVQEWVAALDEKLAARSVQKYWQALAQMLDFALGDAPNPARHKTVKLPYVDVEEATPPTADHFLAMLGKLVERCGSRRCSSIRPRRVSPSSAPGSGKTSTSQTHGSARVA